MDVRKVRRQKGKSKILVAFFIPCHDGMGFSRFLETTGPGVSASCSGAK